MGLHSIVSHPSMYFQPFKTSNFKYKSSFHSFIIHFYILLFSRTLLVIKFTTFGLITSGWLRCTWWSPGTTSCWNLGLWALESPVVNRFTDDIWLFWHLNSGTMVSQKGSLGPNWASSRRWGQWTWAARASCSSQLRAVRDGIIHLLDSILQWKGTWEWEQELLY